MVLFCLAKSQAASLFVFFSCYFIVAVDTPNTGTSRLVLVSVLSFIPLCQIRDSLLFLKKTPPIIYRNNYHKEIAVINGTGKDVIESHVYRENIRGEKMYRENVHKDRENIQGERIQGERVQGENMYR